MVERESEETPRTTEVYTDSIGRKHVVFYRVPSPSHFDTFVQGKRLADGWEECEYPPYADEYHALIRHGFIEADGKPTKTGILWKSIAMKSDAKKELL